MLVKEWMTVDAITVDENTTMMKASQIMKENDIRRLPVIKNGKLIGIVTETDIKEASPSKATTLDIHELYYLLSKIKVKDIMVKKVITADPEDTIEKASIKMLEYKISGLPVVNKNGELLGVITERDIFKVLISITGSYLGGVKFAFNLEDRPGSIREVADVIRKYGGRMVSILTSYDSCEEGCRHVYIRIKDLSEETLKDLIQELDRNFILLYVKQESLQDI